MKKIKNKHRTNKDRVLCAFENGKAVFSYQQIGRPTKHFLFDTNASPSLKDYFNRKGHRMGDQEFSLTIGQLYAFREYYNARLKSVLDRIVKMVEYVLAEEYYVPAKETTNRMMPVHYTFDDNDRAA